MGNETEKRKNKKGEKRIFFFLHNSYLFLKSKTHFVALGELLMCPGHRFPEEGKGSLKKGEGRGRGEEGDQTSSKLHNLEELAGGLSSIW